MSQNSNIMKQDLLTYLPPEIIIEIFTRLPIRSIIQCRRVCKSWLDLIKSNEFVQSHLSKSVYHRASLSNPYKFLEFVESSMNIIFNMIFPHHHQHIHSSVNGLVFLLNLNRRPCHHFICNPITRDYIKLPCPSEYPYSKRQAQRDTFGFGVSKKSSQYKVVRLFYECIPPKDLDYVWKIDYINEIKCEVYTLGTGSWRSIEYSVRPLRYDYEYNTAATFLNGNLHWQGHGLHDDSMWISCFDLETELFTIFSAPPIHGCHYALSILEECLAVCDTAYYVDVRKEIWFMNKYGDDKSWTKKFIITKRSPAHDSLGALRPIKVFEDGDILFAHVFRSRLFCYSNKTKTIEETDLAELYGFNRIGAVSYVPSFVPLNTFTMENVMHVRI